MYYKYEKLGNKILKDKKLSANEKLSRFMDLTRYYMAKCFDGDVKENMSEIHREDIIIDHKDGTMERIQPAYDYYYQAYIYEYAKRVCDFVNSMVGALSEKIDFDLVSSRDQKLIKMASLANSEEKFDYAFSLKKVSDTINNMLKDDELCK